MTKCFVKSCKNSDRRRPPGITFHKIPKKLAKEWLAAICRPADIIVNNQRICSEHFQENDFNRYCQLKTIKENVIPSLSLPVTQVKAVAGDNVSATLLTEEWVANPSTFRERSFSETVMGENKRSKQMAQNCLLLRKQLFETNEISTLIRERSLPDTASTASSLKRMRTLISTIHSYSRSPLNYQNQVRTQTLKAMVYKNKLKTALRTSNRRKQKLVHLKKVVAELRKKYSTLNNRQGAY